MKLNAYKRSEEERNKAEKLYINISLQLLNNIYYVRWLIAGLGTITPIELRLNFKVFEEFIARLETIDKYLYAIKQYGSRE